jgi:hypothetical protein
MTVIGAVSIVATTLDDPLTHPLALVSVTK